ncbi:uncharacterized protein LOC129728329 [Wyeomyia smithii]|uniref:uncharacterized protein LOC129728329 n=1 Tax=Wyeomyia smithii TaxID=174621 RepID=UPI002467ED0F|nr:uncharacterized protein LOC129728329 [Wyeomyia smithii]
MKFLLLSTFLLSLVLPALCQSLHWVSPNLKSLADAQQQCASYLRLSNETVERYVKNGYPDEPSVRKLVHCLLINLNVWDNNNGIKEYVIRNYLQPSPSDCCYVNRTQACIQKELCQVPQTDNVARAYWSFVCYYQHFGNLINEKQFVPYTELERQQHVIEAFSIENIPRQVLENFSRGSIICASQLPELLYTLFVRVGFYDPEMGFNLDRLYTQFGNSDLLSNNTRACEANVRQRYCYEPNRLSETFQQCLMNSISTLQLIQDVAKQALEQPSSPCSTCGSPAPCNRCSPTTRPPPAPVSACSSCGAPAPCNRCPTTPAPTTTPAPAPPCITCGAPAPCNRCPAPPPVPVAPACPSCGSPSPCNTCGRSNDIPRLPAIPCYNGQCF